MGTPKVQIRCESCNTKYNFALPPSVLENPEIPIRFRCSVCAYRFNVEPDKLLAQQGAADGVVRIKKGDSLVIHTSVEDVQLKIDSHDYEATDLISAFGADWIMLSEHPELMFSKAPDDEVPFDDEVFDDESVEESVAEDMSSEQQDWSQLDPFSESEDVNREEEPDSIPELPEEPTMETHFEEEEPSIEEPSPSIEEEDSAMEEPAASVEEVETSMEEAAASPEGVESAIDQDATVIQTESAEFDSQDFDDDNFSLWSAMDTGDEADLDPTEVPKDTEESAVANEEDTRFGFGEDPEDIRGTDDRFDWGDPQAEEDNVSLTADEQEDELEDTVWGEYEAAFEAEEMEEESPQEESPQEEPPQEESVAEEYEEINFIDEADLEQSISKAMQEVDSVEDEERFSLVDGTEPIAEEMPVEIEYEEPVESEDEADEATESQRLSFHSDEGGSPLEAKEITRESSPIWALVALLVVCIVGLVYVNQKEKDVAAPISGLQTNPESTDSKISNNKGLQDNDKESEKKAEKPKEASSQAAKNEKVGKEPPTVDDELNIEPDETIEDISRRGWQALNTNNPDVAIRLFKVVLKQDPKHFYAKALIGAGMKLPIKGGVFLSVRDQDKHMLAEIAGPLYSMGFKLLATEGTHLAMKKLGIPSERVNKVKEGRPDIVDHVRNGRVQLMINTPIGKKSIHDEAAMRLAGLRFGVPCITTIRAATAAVSALRALRAKELRAIKLQELV